MTFDDAFGVNRIKSKWLVSNDFYDLTRLDLFGVNTPLEKYSLCCLPAFLQLAKLFLVCGHTESRLEDIERQLEGTWKYLAWEVILACFKLERTSTSQISRSRRLFYDLMKEIVLQINEERKYDIRLWRKFNLFFCNTWVMIQVGLGNFVRRIE